MGRNDEYSRDAFYEESWDTDDSSDEFENEIDPDDWQQLYSEELYDGWAILQEYLYDNYLVPNGECTFTEFADFVTYPHMYSLNIFPSYHAVRSWVHVRRVPLIAERVRSENFYAWFAIYINDRYHCT
jgi:hypothetical protein